MYARVNIIFGTEAKVGAGVAHIEKSDRDVVEAAAGNRGLTTLVDRKTGVIVAMSYWDDLRHSSEAALTKAREGAAKPAGGTWSPKASKSPSPNDWRCPTRARRCG